MKAQTVNGQLNHSEHKPARAVDPRSQAVRTDGRHEAAEYQLLEVIVSAANLDGAWRRVKANAGAAGIDGMSIEAFPAFWQEHQERIVSQLKEGTYRPAAVRRVWIPKDNGGKRPLGIPTVLDRVIQQAIAQILSLVFEGQFSEHSYGFRSGKRAHDAIRSIQGAAAEGCVYAVDCDLKSFFDRVDHAELMWRLRRRISDARVLGLIKRYLKVGIRLPDGSTEATFEGVPQGGPLSPLLANIMLDDLDQELEQRGHRFARYADDFIIVVKSKRAAERVMSSISGFIETKLKLLVSREKTKAGRLTQCSFLGFVISPKRIRCLATKLDVFKYTIRRITNRSWGISMEERLERLRLYVNGWLGYYAIGLPYRQARSLDKWLRRRVRVCYWKQWRLPRTRYRKLRQLGVNPMAIRQASDSRKGAWRCSKLRVVSIAMNNAWLAEQGCPSIKEQWMQLCYPNG